jgi:hypothetical protein
MRHPQVIHIEASRIVEAVERCNVVDVYLSPVRHWLVAQFADWIG